MTILTKEIDLSNLVLPDGKPAGSLRIGPLYAELCRLKIPGIAAHMGKEELIETYGAHVRAIAEEIRGPERPGMKHPKDISQTVARQAAAVIEQQRAGGLEGGRTTHAPQNPIASTSIRRGDA